ncbi:MAG: sulfurtransferase [Gammaproteobacteria bacterium]|nr:sulfurtransferase [Gammaproteobacteria bacterium]
MLSAQLQAFRDAIQVQLQQLASALSVISQSNYDRAIIYSRQLGSFKIIMPASSQSPIISVAALKLLLASNEVVVVDCRFDLLEPAAGKAQWQRSRIPGARYADLDKDLAAAESPDSGRHPLPDEQLLSARLGSWGITPETQVVVYDAAGGAIAARLWWLLRWLGHKRVAVLDGGWQAWRDSEAVASEAPTALRDLGAYRGTPNSMPTVSTKAIESMDFASHILLDARDALRFAGKVEPIDPVKGHIPRATNLPFQSLLGSSGHFLALSDLRQQFASIGYTQGAAVTCMCGSGVTACHLILAAELAGLGVPALYVGSWSEWIRNDDHPVAEVEL